jgi:hypothetical protein
MAIVAPTDRRTDDAMIRSLIAVDSVAAGLIHVAVVPEHLGEAWYLGAFFIVVAALQILSTIPLVLRSSGPTYAAFAVLNGAIVAIWIVSRTVGVPIAPHAWTPEPIGSLDLAATAFEVLVVAGSLALSPWRGSRSFRAAGAKPPR